MAKKSKSSKTTGSSKSSGNPLSDTTKRWLWVISLSVLFLYSILIWIGKGGSVGEHLYTFLQFLFGEGYVVIPTSLAIAAGSIVYSIDHQFETRRAVSAVLLLISTLILIEIIGKTAGVSGGVIGGFLAGFGSTMIGIAGVTVISIAIIIASIIVLFAPEYDPQDLGTSIKERLFGFKGNKDYEEDLLISGDTLVEEATSTKPITYSAAQLKQMELAEESEYADEEEETKKPRFSIKKPAKEEASPETEDGGFSLPNEQFLNRPYTPPPLSILAVDKGKPGVGDIKANANIIKRTFQNFGIQVEMDEVSIGPTVTRYSFKPAEGVRLSKIISLQSNLELALAAHPVRVEAPIPGKALVGIEVPNSSKTTVGLASLLQSPDYRGSDKPLLITLGKGISGAPVFTDIAKAPHMLIAGATGSGKSVTLHVLVNSLLFRNSPENLRLIMVDPKRVELTLYNGVPHLLNPVITDPKRAVMALKWAVKEMERRYEVLQEHHVQNIASYHQNIVTKAYNKAVKDQESNSDNQIVTADLPEKMPYIVLILDEVGDLMQVYPKEIEAEVIRLAQMSRAVGIHLVLTTQRPDKKVITGLIKANIPTRVALQVSSNIESRIILDCGGAEDLLGAGDMLFQSAKMSKPARIQSPFISEEEVKKVVTFLQNQYRGEIPDEVDMSEPTQKTDLFSIDLESSESDDEDDLYSEALKTVVGAGKASTSYLQRRLKIGYSRAARIMDMLEENGVIGPENGSKPREVLIDTAE